MVLPLYKAKDFFSAFLVCALLVGCSEKDSTESTQMTTQISKPIAFERIEAEDLMVEVIVNQEKTFVSRDGVQADGTWQIPIEVNFGQSNNILAIWSIEYLKQRIVLGEQSEDIFVEVGEQSDTLESVMITNGARRFDVDLDNVSNLQEINSGTNPVSPVAGYIIPEMIDIPAQSFLMGSPDSESERGRDELRHEVSVDAYRIGKYEVTYAEYELWVRDSNFQVTAPSAPWGKALYPVASVLWSQATEYAAWLAEKTGRNFRLPTEAEWELAARGGSSAAFSMGDHITVNDANFDGRGTYNNLSTGDTYLMQTVVTGRYEANGFGLHDVHGNVGEWTCSQYQRDYDGFELVCTQDSNVSVVWRGGPWWIDASGVRSASRTEAELDLFGNGIGFRLAEDL